MTAVADPDPLSAPAGEAEGGLPAVAGDVSPVLPNELVRAICPYLGTGAGWRLAVPERGHRCLAVSPAPQLALEKQARLCLTVAHETCATFEAARAAVEDEADDGPSSGHGPPQRVRRWSVPRTQATVLDVGRGSVDFGAVARQRSSAQVALVLLALVAFGTLILSRLSGDPSAVAAAPTASLPVVAASAAASPITFPAVASPTIDLTPAPAIIPTPTVAPPPTPTAPSSAGPSASPVATPPGSFRLYRVRSGDTLSAIAARFHTTTKALAAENGISDPTRLQIGQVLRIPG